MKLIDTHCHLAHGRLHGQLANVLERAEQAGVIAAVCAAGDLHESKTALDLARRHANVYCMAGVHPHEAAAAPEGYLGQIRHLAGDADNVAIGEIGLDYHYDFSPRDVQRRVFAEQLDLAGKLRKPIVIHTREAFEDTITILGDSRVDGSRVVFHSFAEDESHAGRVLDLGAAIGLSGIATFKKTGYLRRAAAIVPGDRILIETDAPYLSPEPVRKMKTNEPANVAHVCACLAAVRNMSPERFAEVTTANAARFFGLDI